jgi:membrane associated rhomboid family serine protease
MVNVYQVHSKKRKNFFGRLSINSTIILINVICFILFTILISSNIKFLDYIALKPFNILQGAYLWTFLTSMFMHGGFFHLFVNMLSLFFIGSLVEKILGKKRYLYVYLATGLFAGLFFVLSSLIFTENFNVYAVGASGALFGLIGLLMLLTPDLPVYIMFIPIPIKIKYAAPGILILLWIISALGDIPIGNTAHLGGLILGLAYGIYLRKKYKNKTQYIRKKFS